MLSREVSFGVKQIVDCWQRGFEKRELDCPPFECKPVLEILKIISFAIQALNSPHGTGSGGNILLKGCKGVGKTSILKAVELALINIFPDIDVISCDVRRDLGKEKTKKIYSLMEDTHKKTVMLIDEIQFLFHTKEAQKVEAQKLSRKIASLAKRKNYFVIISASSAEVESLVFQCGSVTEEQLGFADFNHTVFSVMRLFPLRTKEEVTTAYEMWKLKEDSTPIDIVFCKTGGVGAFLKTYAEQKGKNSVCNFKRIDNDLVPVLFRLAFLNKGVDCWNQQSIHQFEVQSLVKKDPIQCKKLLNNWVDKNYLCTTDDLNYSLLCFDFYKILMNNDIIRNFETNLVWFSCLRGWVSFRSEESFLKPIVLSRLINEGVLKGCNKIFESKVNEETIDLDINTCYQYYNGLDAFWVWNDVKQQNLCVSGLRLRLGGSEKEITRGTNRSFASRDDTTINGIMTKAVLGFTNILALDDISKLETRGYTVKLGDFYIVTNMSISPHSFSTLAQTWNMAFETVRESCKRIDLSVIDNLTPNDFLVVEKNEFSEVVLSELHKELAQLL